MAPTKTLVEQIAEASDLAPQIGVRSSHASLNDEIAKLALLGLDNRAILGRLGSVTVLDGYRHRTLEEGDVAVVVTFIRQARQRLHAFDTQARDNTLRAARLAELLKR